MDGRVYVEGLTDARRDLRRINPDLAKAIPKTLAASAAIVAREAAARAPRRSGLTARSIKVRVRRNTAAVVVRARKTSPKYPQGYPYAKRVNYTVTPFLTSAMEDKQGEVERRMAGLLDDIADRFERG